MTTIKLKNGSGAPTAGDLVTAEPALDLTNKRLYTEDSGGTVIEVGTNPTSVTTGDITATGTATFAGLTTTGNVSFGDNDKAIFGTGSDLQIYHDGVSRIKELGAGGLYVDVSNDMYIRRNDTSAVMAEFNAGVAKLMFDGNQKLATASTGIDVTGTVTADGLTVDGNATINSASPVLYLTESDTTDLNTRIRSAAGNYQIHTGNDALNSFTARMNISHSTGDISFYDSAGTSQDLFWDASASRLGLGTTSPSTTLDIEGTTSGNLLNLYNNLNASNSETGILFKDRNVVAGGNDAARVYSARDGSNNRFDLVFETADSGTLSEGLRIDHDGNVGIGTASPSETLDVAGTFTSKGLSAYDEAAKFKNNGDAVSWARSDWVNDQASGTGIIYRDQAGTFTFRNDNNSGTEMNTQIVAGGTTAGNIRFNTDSTTESMRIDSSGNLLVGTTTTARTTDGFRYIESTNIARFTSTGNQSMEINRTDASGGTAVIFYTANTSVGTISVTASATSYNTSSDQRLKDNIVDAPSASDDIDAIQVRSFDWKADGSHQKYGMVAQELQTVAPDAVTEGETEEDMMSVDYSKLVPMLVKEIQSLRARVAQLETN